MKCFNITQPELDTIGLMNLVSTSAFSFAAGVFGYCIKDFEKDAASNLIWLPFIAVLIGVGVLAQWKRRGLIEKIKSESSSRPS